MSVGGGNLGGGQARIRLTRIERFERRVAVITYGFPPEHRINRYRRAAQMSRRASPPYWTGSMRKGVTSLDPEENMVTKFQAGFGTNYRHEAKMNLGTRMHVYIYMYDSNNNNTPPNWCGNGKNCTTTSLSGIGKHASRWCKVLFALQCRWLGGNSAKA